MFPLPARYLSAGDMKTALWRLELVPPKMRFKVYKKYRSDAPADVVKNWMRSRESIEFLGLWEQLNNPDFKLVEFDQFKADARRNSFVLSPQKWIAVTGP